MLKGTLQMFRSKGSSSSNGLSRLALADREVWQEVFRISEGAVAMSLSVAHGNDYQGVEKEIVLHGVLWYGKYRAMLVVIFCQNWDVGLGEPKPCHPWGGI